MSIFSRFRDIVSANINAMLDKAEDPEKLIKLMIQEMEDILVEIKASCVGTMASKTRVVRALGKAREHAESWERKARLSVEKGRENLAREALVKMRHRGREIHDLEQESNQLGELIGRFRKDIVELEEKLAAARKKYRVLVQRHIHARKRAEAQSRIRHSETSDAFRRFDSFENRIERVEAEAELINFRSRSTIEDELDRIKMDEEIEDELENLKRELASKTESRKASPK